MPSVYDVIAGMESSGGRRVWGPMTSSGEAEGLYQITTGTWRDFAPKAGVSLDQYPTPNSAPHDIQTQVASVIPLQRWAPSTVAAVERTLGQQDTRRPVGGIQQISSRDVDEWLEALNSLTVSRGLLRGQPGHFMSFRAGGVGQGGFSPGEDEESANEFLRQLLDILGISFGEGE